MNTVDTSSLQSTFNGLIAFSDNSRELGTCLSGIVLPQLAGSVEEQWMLCKQKQKIRELLWLLLEYARANPGMSGQQLIDVLTAYWDDERSGSAIDDLQQRVISAIEQVTSSRNNVDLKLPANLARDRVDLPMPGAIGKVLKRLSNLVDFRDHFAQYLPFILARLGGPTPGSDMYSKQEAAIGVTIRYRLSAFLQALIGKCQASSTFQIDVEALLDQIGPGSVPDIALGLIRNALTKRRFKTPMQLITNVQTLIDESMDLEDACVVVPFAPGIHVSGALTTRYGNEIGPALQEARRQGRIFIPCGNHPITLAELEYYAKMWGLDFCAVMCGPESYAAMRSLDCVD